jgi:hypothetical protein
MFWCFTDCSDDNEMRSHFLVAQLFCLAKQKKVSFQLLMVLDNSKGFNDRTLSIYEGVSKSFWTGSLERELQMVQLSATRRTCIAILCVSLVSFATIILHVAS